MNGKILSLDEANSLIQPLVGLPISLPWEGIGSTIFLELGVLSPLENSRQFHNKGEACIDIDGEWRVEDGDKVLFGSSNSRPEIKRYLEGLSGVLIGSLSIQGEVPELVVHFSNGQILKSFMMQTGDPQWTIRLGSHTWMDCGPDGIQIGDGCGSFSQPSEL
jgi:hypothetical protein